MKKRCLRTVLTMDQLDDLVKDYMQFDEFVFDLETKAKDPKMAVNPLVNEITWISMAGPGRADAIPVAHEHGDVDVPQHSEKFYEPDPKGGIYKSGPRSGEARQLTRTRQVPATFHPPPKQLRPGQVTEALAPLFFSDKRKINQNIKFDLRSIAKYYDGEYPSPPYGETAMAFHLLNENHHSYKLGDMAKRYLGATYGEVGKIGGKEPHKHPFPDAASYAARDSKLTWLLWKLAVPALKSEKLWKQFQFQMDALAALLSAEDAGIPIDRDAMVALGEELRHQKTLIEGALWHDAGKPWDVQSTPQKQWYVYEHRGHEPFAVTGKTRAPSTRATVLEVFARRDPFVGKLLEHASISKTLGTYVDGLLPRLEIDGRLHTEFNQIGTVTGRYSSREPNLQNIPRVSEDVTNRGRLIRSMFVAPKGQKLVVADYDQIELRVIAHFSRDPEMVRIFMEGGDPHLATAAAVLNKDPADVTPDERQSAKTTNFLVGYGGGPQRLAEQAGLGIRKAEAFIESYWQRFSVLERWIDHTKREARQQRIPATRTLFGRKRRVVEMRSSDRGLRLRGERQLINAKIQGSAAEIMVLAMIRFHQMSAGTSHQFVLTVHDELLVLSPDELVDEGCAMLEEAMVGEQLLNVPVLAKAKAADRWSAAK